MLSKPPNATANKVCMNVVSLLKTTSDTYIHTYVHVVLALVITNSIEHQLWGVVCYCFLTDLKAPLGTTAACMAAGKCCCCFSRFPPVLFVLH